MLIKKYKKKVARIRAIISIFAFTSIISVKERDRSRKHNVAILSMPS